MNEQSREHEQAPRLARKPIAHMHPQTSLIGRDEGPMLTQPRAKVAQRVFEKEEVTPKVGKRVVHDRNQESAAQPAIVERRHKMFAAEPQRPQYQPPAPDKNYRVVAPFNTE